MPFKLILLFIILLGSLSSCQKEITAGDPDPLLNDTATLLKMINTRYEVGLPVDSTLRIVKNAYVNGQKRILITETPLPSGTDTTFIEFNYNSADQLTRITRRTNDPVDGINYDEIIWQNDRVSKVRFVVDGVLDYENELLYTQNGINTVISKKRMPPAATDTLYSGGVIQWFNSVKNFLTVNSQFVPVSNTQIGHHYQLQGVSLGLPGNSHDTSITQYSYEGNGNLSISLNHRSVSDTNVMTPLPDITQTKDTIINRYTRSIAENPVVYDLIKQVFGEQLIVLSNFHNVGFGWEDVIGFGGSVFGAWYASFAYYKQTLNFDKRTSVSWTNGIPDPANGTIVDEIIYKADNTFDTQNKLLISLMYFDITEPSWKTRFIYQ